MARWGPVPVVVRRLRALQARVARDLRATAPRVEHRDGTKAPPGDLAGSLAVKVAAPYLVDQRPWGAVLRFADLGQAFLWFLAGTSGGGRVKRETSTRFVDDNGKRKAVRVSKKVRIGGKVRQQARPVDLAFDEAGLVRELEQDAAAFFSREEARR